MTYMSRSLFSCLSLLCDLYEYSRGTVCYYLLFPKLQTQDDTVEHSALLFKEAVVSQFQKQLSALKIKDTFTSGSWPFWLVFIKHQVQIKSK